MITSPGWKKLLDQETTKPYMKQLKQQLIHEYNTQTVYPAYKDILKALAITPFESVKVVILGQDPYHAPRQAQGLSFSVPNGVKAPPSLQNIFKELSADLQVPHPSHTDLTPWAKQGVLLLNTTLTVLKGKPLSHAHLGWEQLTDVLLKAVNDQKNGIVFLLWGGHAQKKATFLDEEKHLIIKSPHPSPLSAYRGFFGSKPFSQTNDYLSKKETASIDWLL